MNSTLLLVSNFLSASGGTRGVCEELALRLQAAGYPVLTTSSQPAKAARLLDMLKTVWSKRHFYKIAQVDVYSGPAFLWAELVAAMLRRLNKPCILTLHGGNLPAFARQNPVRVRRLLSAADEVTTPSRYLLEQMSAYRDDLLLLPNALDLPRYPFRERSPAGPKLVWLRAFHRIYNPSLAPRVLHRLIADFPDAQLTMVGPDKGDGSLQETLDCAAELGVLDRICFQGSVAKEDVPLWINRGDVFLNTTHVDNTPVSVLEAAACGLCIVTTNVGGIPCLLEHERDALLVPADDAEGMARAARRVLTDAELSSRLSLQARAKAQSVDWSAVLPQWERLFETVLNRRVLRK